MHWYWKVRIYRPDEHYRWCQIKTGENLLEINIIQDFYLAMTGCKMLLEGMSRDPYHDLPFPDMAFAGLYHYD